MALSGGKDFTGRLPVCDLKHQHSGVAGSHLGTLRRDPESAMHISPLLCSPQFLFFPRQSLISKAFLAAHVGHVGQVPLMPSNKTPPQSPSE